MCAVALAVFALLFVSLANVSVAAAPAFADDGLSIGSRVSGDWDGDGADDVVLEVNRRPSTDGQGNAVLGEMMLIDAKGYTGESLVLDGVDTDGDGTPDYAIVHVYFDACKGNTHIKSLTFRNDLKSLKRYGKSYRAWGIEARAFEGCTSLERVEFPASTEGMDVYAFAGCTALRDLVFPEGAVLTGAIGEWAFQGCTSLESVTIPPIMSARRYADAYYSATDFDPSAPASDFVFQSGGQPYWHSSLGPCMSIGLAATSFVGCSKLKTIVYKAGNPVGMFAYRAGFGYGGSEPDKDDWRSDYGLGAANIENVVYEAAQMYWLDPHRAAQNGSGPNLQKGVRPAIYYAVDYYATADADAPARDDNRASGRFARVEYKRDTPTSLVATGDAAGLAEWAFADVGAYAEKDEDGIVPDPNEAARAAGLDTSKRWVWKLTDTQSRRSGLSDSCKAYLAEASDLAGGRILSDTIAKMYRWSDFNLMRGSVQDSPFDPKRQGWITYQSNSEAYFTLTTDLQASFYDQVSVVAPDGTVLDPSSYRISFQKYDTETKELSPTELGKQDGALLMTVTPEEGGGYAGTLQEWVLVHGHTGSVKNLFTESSSSTETASVTWRAAIYYWGLDSSSQAEFETDRYAVVAGAGNPAYALIAAGYAGVADAPLSVADAEDDLSGFSLAAKYEASGLMVGDKTAFSNRKDDGTARYDTLSEYAAQVYLQAFPNYRANVLHWSDEQFPWGLTAVIVQPKSVSSVAAAAAAYAYAAKAPVFFTEEDGSVSASTAECLADFSRVVAVGDVGAFSEDALSSVQAAVSAGTTVERLAGDGPNASSLSMAVADALIEEGLATASTVSVAAADDPLDAIGSLNFAGHKGGITLVSSGSADSKAVRSFLRAKRDEVNLVRLFGRSDGNALTEGLVLEDALADLWSQDYDEAASSVAAGDVVEIAGALFEVTGDGDAKPVSFASDQWIHGDIDPGTYVCNGVRYEVGARVPTNDPNPLSKSLADAVISLPQESYDYTGSAIEPTVTVTLDGVELKAGEDYDVTYQNNVKEGAAAVVVAGKGLYTGSKAKTFKIVKKAKGSASMGTFSALSNLSWNVPSASSGGWSNPNASGTVSTGTVVSSGANTSGQTNSGAGLSGTARSTTTGGSGLATLATNAEDEAGGSGLNFNLNNSEDEHDGWLGSDDEGISGREYQQRLGNASRDDELWGDGEDAGEVGSASSSGLSPVVVGIIVALAVAAAAFAVWYALRRRPAEDLDPLEQ